MYPDVWTPHTTVAAVVEHDDQYLMVEEFADGRRVLNQPAGHLEPNERLVDAVAREVLEETGAHFVAREIIGLYRWLHPGNGETYLRIAFCGELGPLDPERELDAPIIAPRWLSRDDLLQQPERLRSPLVMACIDDYRAGRRHPLDLLQDPV